MVLRIVHTADWHLGLSLAQFNGESRRRLSHARYDAVERVLALAEKQRADAVLCAGDLFDGPSPDKRTWEELAQRLQRKSNLRCPVILLPGNHDFLSADSVYHPSHPFRRELPSFVHVVDQDDFELSLGPEAVVYARPCRSAAGQDDPSLKLPVRAPGDERIRIGLVHGTTFDMEGYQTNFPISLEAARIRGLDYLAIGDTHSFRVLPNAEAIPPTVYPSAPEATKFEEGMTGYAALVIFYRSRRCRVEPEPIASLRWEAITVRELEDLRRLCRRPDLRNLVLKLTVDFQTSLSGLEDAESLLVKLAGDDVATGLVAALILDRSRLRLDTSAPLALDSWPEQLRLAASKLREKQRDPAQAAAAERALFRLHQLVQQKAG